MYEPERFASTAYRNVLDAKTSAGACHISTTSLCVMGKSCEACYPHEACGLLIGRTTAEGWLVEDIRAVANLNTERAADRFQLDPQGYREIDQGLRGTGSEIIGTYHSHPDCPARPSPTDLDNAWEGFAYIIVSVHQGAAVDTCCWTLNDQGNKFQSVPIGKVA